MNDKGHFTVSVAKSIIRIVSCIIGFIDIKVLLLGFILAEILGIIEELCDKR